MLGEDKYCVVGDRVDTYMIPADRLGAKKILILTEIADNPSVRKDFVFRNLGEFLDFQR